MASLIALTVITLVSVVVATAIIARLASSDNRSTAITRVVA